MGWDAIDAVYLDPPQSSEQILHPEKYYGERDEPQAVVMPNLEAILGGGWEEQDSDVLGELNLRIYLEAFVNTSEATTATEGWDGDRYLYLTDTEEEQLLVLHSIWDSAADAQEFFSAYVNFVDIKSEGAWTLSSDHGTLKLWEAEGMSLYLGRNGNQVLLIIAPDETITEEALSGFPDFSMEPQATTDYTNLIGGIVSGIAVVGLIVYLLVLRRRPGEPKTDS